MTAFDQVKRALDDVARATRDAARSPRSSNTNINVRKNVKIASNIGSSGETTRATSIQDAPIHQTGKDTDTEA